MTAGRLEVFVDGQWGTICNRSWSEQLARLACNQLGLIMDSEHFENWRIFPSAGSLPMVMDNIRCEEREYDLTQCRHDGVTHNLASSCASTEVVGMLMLLFDAMSLVMNLRKISIDEPHWDSLSEAH